MLIGTINTRIKLIANIFISPLIIDGVVLVNKRFKRKLTYLVKAPSASCANTCTYKLCYFT